jgi:hypothetical protein
LTLLLLFVYLLATHKAGAQVPRFEGVDFVTYQKDSIFSISVPDYLVEVNDLSPEAFLQFKNVFNETYLMVLAEDKSEGVHGSLDLLEEHFKMNLLRNGGVLLNEKEYTVNNLRTIQNEVDWTVEAEPLSYLVTFIESKTTLYKVYCWTRSSNKQYLTHFRQATSSFLLLSNRYAKL